MARQTHFEVMVMQGGNWQIHARFSAAQKEAAIEEAKVLDNTTGIGQVRVVKDVYDTDDGTSEEFIIYKSSKLKRSGGGGDANDDWGAPDYNPEPGGLDDWGDWDYDDNKEDEGFWSKLKKEKKDKPKAKKAKKALVKASVSEAFTSGDKPAPRKPSKPKESSLIIVLVKILLVVVFSIMIGAILALTTQFAIEKLNLARVTRISANMQANIMFALFVLGFLGSAIPMATKFLKSDQLKSRTGPSLLGRLLAKGMKKPPPRQRQRPQQRPQTPVTPTADLEEYSGDEAAEFELPSLEEPESDDVAEEEDVAEETVEEPELEEVFQGEDDGPLLPPHAQEQRQYMRGFIDKMLTETAVDKKQMDNFNKFGVNLFLAGACEIMSKNRSLDEESSAVILSETVQTMGFKKDHADSFSDKYQEYLMADSRYMQMFQAGRNAMNTFFSDEGAAPSHLTTALEDWNKPKQKEDNAGPVTVMFTDMVGSTSLTQRLGDQGAQKVVRAHNRIVREALTQYGGREVKHTGDGIMCSFPTTSNAVECAVMIQKGVLKHNVQNPDLPLGVKIGINAGEPIQEDNDLFGTTVQLAARIVDKAGNYEIFVSEIVRGICAGTTLKFNNRGQYEMKGVEDKMSLYEVVWRDAKDQEMETMLQNKQGAA